MALVLPPRAWRALVITGVATLALAFGACGTANPTLSPSASVAGAEPSPSLVPTIATRTTEPTLTLPPAAHRPQTIHVLEDPIAFHTVSVAGCTSSDGCKGDQLIGTSTMLDADTHERVGTLAVSCLLMDPGKNLYHCPALAITLTGRGQIVFDETFAIGNTDSPLGPWPIISGTGEFLDARGSVSRPRDSTWPYADFVITITG